MNADRTTWTIERDRVAILAGSGRLPLLLQRTLRSAGKEPLIFSLPVDTESGLLNGDVIGLTWETVGDLFAHCREHDIGHVVLAGGISARPDLKPLHMNWPTVKLLPEVFRHLLKGDDAVLSSIATMFERRGLGVLGAHEIAPELVICGETPTKRNVDNDDRQSIIHGFEMLDAVSPFDMGQAVVMMGHRPIALEGAEGTDGMLQRVADMRARGRLPERRGGLLVKAPKTGQDLRFDMPAVGPDTVKAAIAAGLDGIAVKAEETLLLDRAEVIDLANRGDLFVTGIGR